MSEHTTSITAPARVALVLIRAYRFAASPWIGTACRFWPTCSEYALHAIEQHGAARGGWMVFARLLRCHPYSAGGVDPVPQQFRWRCWCSAEQARPGSSASQPCEVQARNPTAG